MAEWSWAPGWELRSSIWIIHVWIIIICPYNNWIPIHTVRKLNHENLILSFNEQKKYLLSYSKKESVHKKRIFYLRSYFKVELNIFIKIKKASELKNKFFQSSITFMRMQKFNFLWSQLEYKISLCFKHPFKLEKHGKIISILGVFIFLCSSWGKYLSVPWGNETECIYHLIDKINKQKKFCLLTPSHWKGIPD